MSKALKLAIEKNDRDAAVAALKTVKDVNRKLPGAARPLEYAAKMGADSIIELLLKAGAKTDAESTPGGVLAVGAQNKKLKVIEVLARLGVMNDAQIDWSMDESVLDGRVEAVAAILEHFEPKTTPKWIRLAGYRKNLRILKLLFEYGADVNSSESIDSVEGTTPLHSVLGAADVPFVRTLVECGADLNARDSLGRTPLMLLAHQMEALAETHGVEMMQALIELGADASAIDHWGNDATDHYRFEMARFRKQISEKVVTLLTKAGGKGSLPTFELFMAIGKDDLGKVHKAIADGADVNRIAPPHWNCTPLILASSKSPEIVQALIDGGADVNKPDRRRLPLTSAAEDGNLPVVKLLIEKGAKIDGLDPRDTDSDQPPRNALVAAKERDREEVVKYLESLGASKPKLDKWKSFEAGVASWNDFSEVLVNASAENVAKALATMIEGKAQTSVYGQAMKIGKRAYVVTQPKGMKWSNVFQVSPPRMRFDNEKKMAKLATDLAAATKSQAIHIEYSDTSDACMIVRYQPDGTSTHEEGVDRDILEEMVGAMGDQAPEWAKKQLAQTEENEPSSTSRLKMLAEHERFVVAAFGFDGQTGREMDVEVRGYPAEAFEGVAWVSSE